MTPEAAVYSFLASFGIPAYAETSVPDEAVFPYLTYSLVVPDLFEQANMQVNVWYRTDSEADPNAKVREIGEAVQQRALVPLACDSGVILIGRGSPWAQSLSIEGEDSKVKRRLLNFTVESAIIDGSSK